MPLPRSLILLALIAGCGGSAVAPGDAGPGTCASDVDCIDGLFCNGVERCRPDDPDASRFGCIAGPLPCAAGVLCDERQGTCGTSIDCDRDGDGAVAIDCGGDDCDDADPLRYPGNTEVCDAAGRDEDCDPETLGSAFDGDRDGDGEASIACCYAGEDGVVCGTDCDDTRPTINARGVESCNGFDDDCDGRFDEGVQLTFYRDLDGDEFGRTEESTSACTAPAGFAIGSGDCDESTRQVNPNATELCDGVDNDCDGTMDPGCDCTAGMSRPCGELDAGGAVIEEGECRAGTQRCSIEGRWGACDGAIVRRPESCNFADDDCDGDVDEGGLTRTCVTDVDADGFPPADAETIEVCGPCPGGTSELLAGMPIDCDDENREVRPGQLQYFTTPRDDGSFDYDCDEAETPLHPTESCRDTPSCAVITPSFEDVFDNGVYRDVRCGETRPLVFDCRNDGENCNATLSRSETQACR